MPELYNKRVDNAASVVYDALNKRKAHTMRPKNTCVLCHKPFGSRMSDKLKAIKVAGNYAHPSCVEHKMTTMSIRYMDRYGHWRWLHRQSFFNRLKSSFGRTL